MKKVEYTIDHQILFLQTIITDKELLLRSQNIIKPQYFDPKLRGTVKFILSYVDKYNEVPLPEQIYAETKIELEKLTKIPHEFDKWFLENIEEFCRNKAVSEVIMDGPELLETNDYGLLEHKLKEALTISLHHDLGVNYFADPETRLKRIRENNVVISTGWDALDKTLFGGWGRGSLNFFVGNSGAGKSLFLQNMAVNYVLMGLNVVYFTLELSEDLVCMRLDSMMTEISSRKILSSTEDVALKLSLLAKRKKLGTLQVKKFPEGGTTTNILKTYLKEYEIQNGIKFDVILVDYLDLLYPNSKRVNPSDHFIKDKFCTEELRALMGEYDAIGVSASQFNRTSLGDDVMEYNHSHVAGGISKINTADNVLAIHFNKLLMEQGKYKLQVLKARNSSGTGLMIDLAYNRDTLRISNLDEDENEDDSFSLKTKMTQKLVQKNDSVSTPNNSKKDLKQLLASINNK